MSKTSREDPVAAAVAALKACGEGHVDPYEVVMKYNLCGEDHIELDAGLWENLLDEWHQKTRPLRITQTDKQWGSEKAAYADNMFRAYCEVFDFVSRTKDYQAELKSGAPQTNAFSRALDIQTTDMVSLSKFMTSQITRNAFAQLKEVSLDGKQMQDSEIMGFLAKVIRHSVDSYKEIAAEVVPVHPRKSELREGDDVLTQMDRVVSDAAKAVAGRFQSR